MRATSILRSAARTPLIHFIGKRSVPSTSNPCPSSNPETKLTSSQSPLTTLLVFTPPLPPARSLTLSPPTVLRLSSTVPSVAPPSTAPLAVTPVLPWAPSSPRRASSSIAPSFPHASAVCPGPRPRSRPLRPAARACLHKRPLGRNNNCLKMYEWGILPMEVA